MSGPTVEKSPSRGVALTWLEEETLEMKLADNTTHQILLSVAENIPGVVDPCLFSGILVGDPESLVSVSGCKTTATRFPSPAKIFLDLYFIMMIILPIKFHTEEEKDT